MKLYTKYIKKKKIKDKIVRFWVGLSYEIKLTKKSLQKQIYKSLD